MKVLFVVVLLLVAAEAKDGRMCKDFWNKIAKGIVSFPSLPIISLPSTSPTLVPFSFLAVVWHAQASTLQESNMRKASRKSPASTSSTHKVRSAGTASATRSALLRLPHTLTARRSPLGASGLRLVAWATSWTSKTGKQATRARWNPLQSRWAVLPLAASLETSSSILATSPRTSATTKSWTTAPTARRRSWSTTTKASRAVSDMTCPSAKRSK